MQFHWTCSFSKSWFWLSFFDSSMGFRWWLTDLRRVCGTRVNHRRTQVGVIGEEEKYRRDQGLLDWLRPTNEREYWIKWNSKGILHKIYSVTLSSRNGNQKHEQIFGLKMERERAGEGHRVKDGIGVQCNHCLGCNCWAISTTPKPTTKC